MKKSDLPQSVTIGGIRFSVVWEDEGNMDEGDWGGMNIDKRAITLNEKGLREGNAMDTLIHELIHASLCVGGVSYGLKGKQEESIVRNIEHLFLPVLRRLIK